MPAGLSDGQTNWIKIIPFVCMSQVRAAGRVSCADGLSDGQTNWIKIIPFVCLSQVRLVCDNGMAFFGALRPPWPWDGNGNDMNR